MAARRKTLEAKEAEELKKKMAELANNHQDQEQSEFASSSSGLHTEESFWEESVRIVYKDIRNYNCDIKWLIAPRLWAIKILIIIGQK